MRTGFFGRFFDTLTSPYAILKDVPVGGVGLGMGTNAGAAMLTGKRVFLVAEGEWPRVLMESGPVVGATYILLRGVIVVAVGLAGLRSLRRDANTLPLLIFTGGFIEILQGQFSQPSSLGFAVIAGGLSLAACRVPAKPAEEELPKVAGGATRPRAVFRARALPEPAASPVMTEATQAPAEPVPGAVVATPVLRRGRSAYAERLHGPNKD